MPLRLVAILALLLQPLLVGTVALRTCQGNPCHSEEKTLCCCAGDQASFGDACGDRPCDAPCCTDITGEGEPLAAQCVCEPGPRCACPLTTSTRADTPWTAPAPLRALRHADEHNPFDDLTWTSLPAHTRVSLALPGWTWSDDRAPDPADDASAPAAPERLARLCVWTI